MKKADKILIFFIMMALILFLLFFIKNPKEAQVAVVKIKNQEVMRLNLNEDQKVSVKGTLGDVVIVIKNHQVAVVQENSPQHVCSIQGYVSSPSTPIICLPNDVVVEIVGLESSEDTTIS